MTNLSPLKPDDVVTLKDFCSFVENLAKESQQSELSLEEYLRAFWLLVQTNQNAKASFTLFANMLSQALTSPIASFDNDWLNYTAPPPEIGYSQPVEDGIGFLKKMLLYQIADLHRMKEEGVLDQPPHILWLGTSRKGGRTWYNFLPSTFLSCALGGLNANSETTDCDWSILAVFLWLGQIYE
jgi:hypothetical protein